MATAAVLLDAPPPNLSVLSAHKYIPPAMEIVVEMPGSRVQGFLAAGHAATITGWGVFEPFVARQRRPVVVAGFEPLDILAALVALVGLVRAGTPRVVNAFRRCVTREGNRNAQETLWRVFELVGGRWRGIARVPNGNLRLRPEFARTRRAAPPRAPARDACTSAGRAAPARVPLRRDHGRTRHAFRLPPVRTRVRSGRTGGGLHGEQRGNLSHLAPVRRAPATGGDRLMQDARAARRRRMR